MNTENNPDPLAEVKSAHAAGKRVQYRPKKDSGLLQHGWETGSKLAWLSDFDYRVHPDDLAPSKPEPSTSDDIGGALKTVYRKAKPEPKSAGEVLWMAYQNIKAPSYAEEDPEEVQLWETKAKAVIDFHLSKILHASAPNGMQCADCIFANQPCHACYASWWDSKYQEFIKPTARQTPDQSSQQPVEMPSVEQLANIYVEAYRKHNGRFCESQLAGVAAVRDAMLKAMTPRYGTGEGEVLHPDSVNLHVTQACLDTAVKERDDWKARALAAEKERDELRSQLDALTTTDPPEEKKMVPWKSTRDFPKIGSLWLRGKQDYREHLVIGIADDCAFITASCGCQPVLASSHVQDWNMKEMEWSSDRNEWQPCEKEDKS